jgi:hypothetical protein
MNSSMAHLVDLIVLLLCSLAEALDNETVQDHFPNIQALEIAFVL